MGKMIKLFDPVITKNMEKETIKVIRSKFWASGSGVGKVKEFEKSFSKYLNSKDCIAVNSGTAALHLALNLEGVKGKQVIIPSLSFASTAHAVVYNGGKPIFADVNPETLCIDPSDIESKINGKTSVILPVHFGGMSCELSEIIKICKKYNLTLIEDAAHAAGATYKKKKIGVHGKYVCFSFHPVKNLAMPTGGAIAINDKQFKKSRNQIESLRWCGIDNRKGASYDITKLGWNYYMNEISAAIGLEQLKILEKTNKKRRHIAKRYSKELDLSSKMPYNDECSYHLYWIRVKNRVKFMKNLKDEGIESGIHYKPIHKMTYYNSKQKLPVTETISKQIVSLPIHPNLNDSQVNKIIKISNRYG